MLNMVLDLLLKQIFGQPFILMALIVLIGYIAMGQKMSKALTGSIKASIGILVMGMGSGALIGNFGKLIVALQTSTGITGAGLNTYPTMTAGYEVMDSVLGAGTGASWGIYTLLVAFILTYHSFPLRFKAHIGIKMCNELCFYFLSYICYHVLEVRSTLQSTVG